MLVTIDNHRLTASELRFDGDRLLVIGDLVYEDGAGVRLLSNGADLSGDFANGVFRQVQVQLASRLQVVAERAIIHDALRTSFDNASITPCYICEDDKTPLWYLRSTSKIYSKETGQIYLRHPRLYIRDVPVFYLPWLSFPGPEIKRQDGFLPPTLRSSKSEGTSVTLPYYKTLGPYADVTVSPYLSNRGRTTLDTRYRQRLRIGSLDMTGSVSWDRDYSDEARSYLSVDGDVRLPRGYRLAIDATGVSDPGYLDDFGISSADILANRVQLWRRSGRSYVSAERIHYKPLAGRDATFEPRRHTYIFYRRHDPVAGGMANLHIDSEWTDEHSPWLTSVTVSTLASWGRRWMLASGLTVRAKGGVRGRFDRETDTGTRSRRSAGADGLLMLGWPLARVTKRARHSLEPLAQLVWSSDEAHRSPDSGRQLIVLDDTSMFAADRLPGLRDRERGWRLNLGLRHTSYFTEGVTSELFIGRVFRRRDRQQFSPASGLAGTASDVVAAIDLSFPAGVEYRQTLLIDGGPRLRASETFLTMRGQQVDASIGYLHADRDAKGGMTSEARSVALASSYRVNRNWSTKLDIAYDITRRSKRAADLTIEYRNECALLAVAVGRELIPGSDNTSFGVTLAFGGFDQKGTQPCG